MATEAFYMAHNNDSDYGEYKVGAAAVVLFTSVSSVSYTVPSGKFLVVESNTCRARPDAAGGIIAISHIGDLLYSRKIVAPENTIVKLNGGTSDPEVISGFLYDATDAEAFYMAHDTDNDYGEYKVGAAAVVLFPSATAMYYTVPAGKFLVVGSNECKVKPDAAGGIIAISNWTDAIKTRKIVAPEGTIVKLNGGSSNEDQVISGFLYNA